MNNRHPWQLKSFEVANLTALAIWPIWPNFEVNGLDWQYCLAGSSKTAPRIFIFSIVLGAKYLSYVKSIATCAPTFFGYVYFFSLSQCVRMKTLLIISSFARE